MQEGFHWTVKSGTQARVQPLQQLPFYVGKQLKQRNDTWLAKEGSHWAKWNEGAVLAGLQKSGCQQLIDKGKEFLTPEGFAIMLGELRDGCVGYVVTKLASKVDAIALCKSIPTTRCHRAASASLFLCLLRATVDHPQTVYLQVSSNVGNDHAHDVVMVHESGSFACTDPFFAQMGMPGRHILACHHAQFCNVNVVLHFHPRYLRKFSKPASVLDGPFIVATMSLSDKICHGTAKPEHNRQQHVRPQFSRLTSWSWAVSKVMVRAEQEVLGGAETQDARRPTVHAIRESLESKLDDARKARNIINSARLPELLQAAALINNLTGEKKNRNPGSRKRKHDGGVDPVTGAQLAQPPLTGASHPTKRKKTGHSSSGASQQRTKRV